MIFRGRWLKKALKSGGKDHPFYAGLFAAFWHFNWQQFFVVMMWSTVSHTRDCSQLSFCWQPSWVSVFFYWNLSTYSKATVLLFKASQASLSRPGAAATNSETPCICSCLSFLPLLAKALPKELGHGFCSQMFDCFLERPHWPDDLQGLKRRLKLELCCLTIDL